MINKTTAIKLQNVKSKWHLIDAKDEVLGRLATKIAKLLIGKNKAIFSANANVGDTVVITNAEKFAVTGKKMRNKKYTWYTGFPGGLRTQSLQEKLSKNPTDAIRSAVEGMLPKNKLKRLRMRNLHIYKGQTHPHTANFPRPAQKS